MTEKPFNFLHPAEQELIDAVAYYQLQRPGLEREFIAAFEHCVAQILSFPEAWPPFLGQVRRCQLLRFPYRIYYIVNKDEIVGVAFEHASRDPLYWIDRLGS